MHRFTRALKYLLPTLLVKHIINIRRTYFLDYNNLLYSQSGEDGILKGLFFDKLQKQEKGLYVDIGCYHPHKYSNTFNFYNSGWSGLNVDVNPLTIREFNLLRARDTNVNMAIWDSKKKVEFYYNTHTPEISYVSDKPQILEKNFEKTVVEANTLANIFKQYIPETTPIDFLSVDVEGSELNILSSNNWDLYRPKVILAEQLGVKCYELKETDLSKYLAEHDYLLFTFTVLKNQAYSVFYLDRSFFKKLNL